MIGLPALKIPNDVTKSKQLLCISKKSYIEHNLYNNVTITKYFIFCSSFYQKTLETAWPVTRRASPFLLMSNKGPVLSDTFY